MILPATATLATGSHCSSAAETSPLISGPSNKCDFGGTSEPMPPQPQQRSALTTLPTAAPTHSGST